MVAQAGYAPTPSLHQKNSTSKPANGGNAACQSALGDKHLFDEQLAAMDNNPELLNLLTQLPNFDDFIKLERPLETREEPVPKLDEILGRAVPEPRGRVIANFVMDDLRPYFNMSRLEAARKLGIGLSSLKRCCASLGIQRWPHRKLSSLHALYAYQAQQTSNDWSAQQELLQAIQREIDAVIQNPDHQIDVVVEAHRVAKYKRIYNQSRSLRSQSSDVALTAGDDEVTGVATVQAEEEQPMRDELAATYIKDVPDAMPPALPYLLDQQGQRDITSAANQADAASMPTLMMQQAHSCSSGNAVTIMLNNRATKRSKAWLTAAATSEEGPPSHSEGASAGAQTRVATNDVAVQTSTEHVARTSYACDPQTYAATHGCGGQCTDATGSWSSPRRMSSCAKTTWPLNESRCNPAEASESCVSVKNMPHSDLLSMAHGPNQASSPLDALHGCAALQPAGLALDPLSIDWDFTDQVPAAALNATSLRPATRDVKVCVPRSAFTSDASLVDGRSCATGERNFVQACASTPQSRTHMPFIMPANFNSLILTPRGQTAPESVFAVGASCDTLAGHSHGAAGAPRLQQPVVTQPTRVRHMKAGQYWLGARTSAAPGPPRTLNLDTSEQTCAAETFQSGLSSSSYVELARHSHSSSTSEAMCGGVRHHKPDRCTPPVSLALPSRSAHLMPFTLASADVDTCTWSSLQAPSVMGAWVNAAGHGFAAGMAPLSDPTCPQLALSAAAVTSPASDPILEQLYSNMDPDLDSGLAQPYASLCDWAPGAVMPDFEVCSALYDWCLGADCTGLN